MRQTTTAGVRHDEGKTPRFMSHEAGIHRFRCPRHPSRLGLFAMDAPKPDNGACLSRNPRKNFLLSVNYLTLLDRFRERRCLSMTDRGAYLANAGQYLALFSDGRDDTVA
jgi:hypothetical protein